MRPTIVAVLLAALLPTSAFSRPSARAPEAPRQTIRVLVVTGGHDYPTSFYTVFEQDGLAWEHAVSNEEAFRHDPRGRYDVLVLYDMSATLSEAGKANLRAFAEGGGGIVALHHAIVSYQDWPWYRDLIGGRYVETGSPSVPASTYLHDQDVPVRVTRAHPVTAEVALTRIHDETYKGMIIAGTNTVLLETDHPASDRPIAWVSAYPKARVVYIQLGHGAEAHRSPGYRTLVANAIRWVAAR